jgi:hypothetical protein
MTKFVSKEEILKDIEHSFNLLNEGKLELNELELLVDKTRELYERALILRHKVYEEKVFGEVKEVLEDNTDRFIGDDSCIRNVIKAVIDEEELLSSETGDLNDELSNQLNNNYLDNNINNNIEQKQTHFSTSLSIEQIPNEPIFDFDIFNEKVENEFVELNDEISDELSDDENVINVNNEFITEDDSSANKEVDSSIKTEDDDDLEDKEIDINEEEINIGIEKEIIQDEIDFISKIEHNASLNPEENNNIDDKIDVNPFESEDELILKENDFESLNNHEEDEIDLNQDEIQEIELNKAEMEIEQSNLEIDDVFSSILIKNDLLSNRLMYSKLDSLFGAFGINEKIQMVEELFNGSNDDFNQALIVLDQAANFDEAKKQLLFYKHLNKWNIENQTTIDFIQKIQRRFS